VNKQELIDAVAESADLPKASATRAIEPTGGRAAGPGVHSTCITRETIKVKLTIRRRNDVAAFFLLKALRPEKYRENVKIDHAGAVNLVERLKAGRERLAKRWEEEQEERAQKSTIEGAA
jgi:hypothetical protein